MREEARGKARTLRGAAAWSPSVVRVGRPRFAVACLMALGVGVAAATFLGGCRKGGEPPDRQDQADGRRSLRPRDQPDPGAGPGASVASQAPAHTALLRNVVDPWSWPRARGATDRDRAIEDIGPYERQEPPPADHGRMTARAAGEPGVPRERVLNTNAHYWTELVGIAWTRDVHIDFDDEPVDLDGDGASDVRITRHIHAPGGVLANPELFGLVPTPDDPRGRVGRVSASTGVLGLREPLEADGRPSGMIGMTCFLCHGGQDPRTGQTVLGLPGSAFDYGLLLATAAILEETNHEAAAYRQRLGHPSGRAVRARLLLAGPGRQDLTGEFGLDATVRGTHSTRYPGARRWRQGIRGVVNPISVPGILAASGVDVQNWSGSEVASARWLARLLELGGAGAGSRAGVAATSVRAGEILAALELPLPRSGDDDLVAASATRRALLMDLRNLGTLGLQQDSFPGLLWADAITGRATLDPAMVAAIPHWYAAGAVRRIVEASGAADLPRRDPRDEAAVARGRELFSSRPTGVIANQQVLKELPARLAALKLTGPVLAPIDEALPPVFSVRCADCHNATVGGGLVRLAESPPPLGRCSHCHRAHAPWSDGGAEGRESSDPRASGEVAGDHRRGDAQAVAAAAAAGAAGAQPGRLPLAELGVPADGPAELRFCGECHDRHRPFVPMAFSSSLLLPFDADLDGNAQGDEAGDLAAGGIGTEALLAFDVPKPERPPGGFSVEIPRLTSLHRYGRGGRVETARTGVSWVRVAPLVAIAATAPYLHNGSVPTLRALLEPPAKRPIRFPLGRTGFVLDSRIAGNRSFGHVFGTRLTAREKADLIAFLETL